MGIFRATTLCLLGALVMVVTAEAARGRPWYRRRGVDVEMLHSTAHKNTPPGLWPAEPPSPGVVQDERFAEALERLCKDEPRSRASKIVQTLLREARRFEIDPFLLAGLVYDQSRCRPRTPKRDAKFGRFGLTRLPIEMHRPHVREGSYLYYVKTQDGWQQRTLKMEKYPFNRHKANKTEPNLYFAAALLKVLHRQAGSLDGAFRGVDHRHAVSHWFFGDRVGHVEPENRVLTARRRILHYYLQKDVDVVGTYKGKRLYSPLDGVPRLMIDYFGNRRGAQTGPGHRGIDIDGVKGEPIRAIADGRVVFAGIDLPGSRASVQASPEAVAEFPWEEMGPGGIYVAINHGDHFGTLYMHLDSTTVGYGDRVQGGDIIGTMGRSGTETSAPHLHLEFREGTQRLDPGKLLSSVLVNPYLAANRKHRR